MKISVAIRRTFPKPAFYDAASFEFRDASLVLSSQIRGKPRVVGERKEKRTSNQEHVDLARRAVETRIFIHDDRTISREEAAHATFVYDLCELTRRARDDVEL